MQWWLGATHCAGVQVCKQDKFCPSWGLWLTGRDDQICACVGITKDDVCHVGRFLWALKLCDGGRAWLPTVMWRRKQIRFSWESGSDSPEKDWNQPGKEGWGEQWITIGSYSIFIFSMYYFMSVISFCIIRKIRKFSIKKYLVTSLTLPLLLIYLGCLQYSEIFYPFLLI